VSTDFQIGQTYSRLRDVHSRFGGQRQSGIVTPANYPAVFIFTGRGTRHGYADEWSADGAFRYFGEGQKGDMTLTKGNKAIANHAAHGKDLLLFEMLGAAARFAFVGRSIALDIPLRMARTNAATFVRQSCFTSSPLATKAPNQSPRPPCRPA
jgi:hypothetical protein